MLEVVIVLQLLLARELEALVISFLLVFNVLVALLQERRAQDALALPRKSLQVRARVLRDCHWQQIAVDQAERKADERPGQYGEDVLHRIDFQLGSFTVARARRLPTKNHVLISVIGEHHRDQHADS